MRVLLTLAAYLGTLAVVSVAAFFIVIVLAGPHAGLLPHPLEVLVLVAGWLAVLGVPLWMARVVWRRTRPTMPPNGTPHADARDVPGSAGDIGARAGERERYLP